jgi:hypothetical protein
MLRRSWAGIDTAEQSASSVAIANIVFRTSVQCHMKSFPVKVHNVTEANQYWLFASPWYSFKDASNSTSNTFTHGSFYVEH